MADNYVFKLSHGTFTLNVENGIGSFDSWEATPSPNCLMVEDGKVQFAGGDMVLSTKYTPSNAVITLHGASWDSQVGATGQATIHDPGCKPSKQTWRLVSRD